VQKFEWILKYNFGGDRIFDGKCQKNDGLSHILEKLKHLSTKTLPQKFCILIMQVMLKLRFILKYNFRGDRISILAWVSLFR
jgi:hypothetical protein